MIFNKYILMVGGVVGLLALASIGYLKITNDRLAAERDLAVRNLVIAEETIVAYKNTIKDLQVQNEIAIRNLNNLTKKLNEVDKKDDQRIQNTDDVMRSIEEGIDGLSEVINNNLNNLFIEMEQITRRD